FNRNTSNNNSNFNNYTTKRGQTSRLQELEDEIIRLRTNNQFAPPDKFRANQFNNFQNDQFIPSQTNQQNSLYNQLVPYIQQSSNQQPNQQSSNQQPLQFNNQQELFNLNPFQIMGLNRPFYIPQQNSNVTQQIPQQTPNVTQQIPQQN